MKGYDETSLDMGGIVYQINALFLLRGRKLGAIAGQSLEKALSETFFGMEPGRLQEQAFARLLAISRGVNEYAALIEMLDEPRFEVALEDFEGMI